MGQTLFWSVSWSAAWAQGGQEETDAIWACHSGEPIAREERHALAIVRSLRINPYCS